MSSICPKLVCCRVGGSHCSNPPQKVHLFMAWNPSVISAPSVLPFGRRNRDDGCAKSFFFFSPFEQAAIWLLQLKPVILSVSFVVSGALDWALSACEHGERLCVKALGQDKRRYDSKRAEGRGIGDCSLLGWTGNVS